jgi:hypothetical protein
LKDVWPGVQVKHVSAPSKDAYIAIGASVPTFLEKVCNKGKLLMFFFIPYRDSTIKADSILRTIRAGGYSNIIVSVGGYSLRPANNYGISNAAIDFFNKLQEFNPNNYIFGNVLAIRNFFSAKHLVACYQDDDITQYTAADVNAGDIVARGKLPVSIAQFKYGYSAPLVFNKLPTKFLPG